MTTMYEKAKIVRRRKQASVNSQVKSAMRGLPSRTAKLTFDLTKRDDDKAIDMSRNARIKVISVVAKLLDSFDLPSRPKLDYLGTIKEATTKDGVVEDGIMKVGAVLQTLLGHKISIDIPVIIKKRSILEPAVFFCDGSPFVLCKPALDQLVKRGTLNKEVLERKNLFSPPILDQWLGLGNETARAPIINRDHMFNPGSRNPWKFRRYSQVEAALGLFQGWDKCTVCGQEGKVYSTEQDLEPKCAKCWEEVHPPSRPVQAAKEKVQRERTNIDTPTEFPEIWKGDVEHQLLDPAERSREDLFTIGEKVTLKEDFAARERGGGSLVIPSGEKGEIVRDMKGDGLCLAVVFPDMGVTTVVPKRFLKGASTRPFDNQNAINPVDQPVEMLPDKNAAVTIDQVKNEVRDMLREGYQTVDIKAALQKRYPEFADEALGGLDKDAQTESARLSPYAEERCPCGGSYVEGKCNSCGGPAPTSMRAAPPPLPTKGRRPLDIPMEAQEGLSLELETTIPELMKKVPYPGSPVGKQRHPLSGMTMAQIMQADPAEAYKIVSQQHPGLVSQFLKMMKTGPRVSAKVASVFNEFYTFVKQAQIADVAPRSLPVFAYKIIVEDGNGVPVREFTVKALDRKHAYELACGSLKPGEVMDIVHLGRAEDK